MYPANAPYRSHSYLMAASELRENPGQWSAYESKGHCVVLAGPGSGKTKTLTIKMARMIAEDIQYPRGLACLTYNAECVRELRSRLTKLGIEPSHNVFVGTVHSFCLHHILTPFSKLAGLTLPMPLKVAPTKTQARIFNQAVEAEIGIHENIGKWRTDADKYRRTHPDRTDFSWCGDYPDLAKLIEAYERGLRTEGYIDFDDMVLNGLCLLESHDWVRKILTSKFPIIVVDEYQDLGRPLHNIVMNLCFRGGTRLFAVGDPDQSIYGFTGAQPELLRELSGMYGVETARLTFNYRCGSTIVSASEVTIGEQRGFMTPPGAHQGTIDFYEYTGGIEEQAKEICEQIIPSILERRPHTRLGDIAVLYLDKNDGNVIAQAAETSQTKYIRVDGNAPYPRTPLTRWLEECALWCSHGWKTGGQSFHHLSQTWLNFHREAKSEIYARTIRINLARFLWSNRDSGIPLFEWLKRFEQKCLHTLLSRSDASDEQDAFQSLLSASGEGGRIATFSVDMFSGQAGSPNHLNLITLHSAKGLEFDAVILMGMEQGRIPGFAAKSDASKKEARRLFYVGLTRARHEVHITYSGWYRFGTRTFAQGRSEFVSELYGLLKPKEE